MIPLPPGACVTRQIFPRSLTCRRSPNGNKRAESPADVRFPFDWKVSDIISFLSVAHDTPTTSKSEIEVSVVTRVAHNFICYPGNGKKLAEAEN